MKNHIWCLVLFVLASTFSTPSSFSLKNLFHDSVEGVDINLDKGHSTVSVVGPNGTTGAGAEAAANVLGDKGSAKGKGLGEGKVTLADGTNVTAFAKTTQKQYKYKWLDLGYEHATGGYKIETNDSSSQEKESRTRFSLGFHLGNKTKTISTPVFHF